MRRLTGGGRVSSQWPVRVAFRTAALNSTGLDSTGRPASIDYGNCRELRTPERTTGDATSCFRLSLHVAAVKLAFYDTDMSVSVSWNTAVTDAQHDVSLSL